METSEIYKFIENIEKKEEQIDNKDLKKLISALYNIIKKQNEVIFEFRNRYIKLENCTTILEDKVKTYSSYKKLCDIILSKTETNPLSALWFLYTLKRKVKHINK